MATYQAAAEAGFRRAREIYTGEDDTGTALPMTERYKSSYKLYVSAAASSAAFLKWEEGFVKADPAYAPRLISALTLHGKDRVASKMQGDFLDQGRLLRLSKAQALNCGELAAIAAETAYRELGNNKQDVAITVLTAPADHVFAVVGLRGDITASLDGAKIKDLDALAPSIDVWIVDPWLNIWCRANDYGTSAAAKFGKWQTDNKRIYWGSGTQGKGWYAPVGDYSTGFADAAIKLIYPN